MVSFQDGSPSDDDVDPRSFFDSGHRVRVRDRKTRMLCSQVADCLLLVLESGVSDEDLQDVWLRDVEPFPDAGTLRVTVAVPHSSEVDVVLGALGRASGYLRSEVARAVCRKRAPQLVFRVVTEDGP